MDVEELRTLCPCCKLPSVSSSDPPHVHTPTAAELKLSCVERVARGWKLFWDAVTGEGGLLAWDVVLSGRLVSWGNFTP